MPTQGLIVETVNFDELRQAFDEAPKETFRYVKTALFRFARRAARKTKTGYLKGAPGIKGGPWGRVSDRNIRGFTTGADLSGLKAVTKASRIVRTHIEGATITPRAGGFLFLSRKTGVKGQGQVFARVTSVTIPARIPFESVWRGQLPKAGEDVADAMARAMKVALDRRMKAVSRFVSQAVA